MTELLCTLASMALIAWSCATRPSTWRAPKGWYINGSRPSGWFQMRPVLGDPDDDVLDGAAERDIDDRRALTSRIYCTGGATPHVAGTSVWCQR